MISNKENSHMDRRCRRTIDMQLVFSTSPLFDAPTQGNPLEFVNETYLSKTRVMGLLNGENCIILTSTDFTDPPMWQTKGRTIAYRAICVLSHVFF